jgi:hypothetical protein
MTDVLMKKKKTKGRKSRDTVPLSERRSRIAVATLCEYLLARNLSVCKAKTMQLLLNDTIQYKVGTVDIQFIQ